MYKNLILKKSLAVCCAVLFGLEMFAQQTDRYQQEIFTEVEIRTEVYNAQLPLAMDIYQPKNDTATHRPLLILAHGGGFLGGSKESPTMVRMANNMAKRGFVVASINYRLGKDMGEMFDTTRAIDVVVKAVADGRASVRFLRESFQNGNPFGIDTARIAFAGNSAGGIVAMHVGFLDAQDSVSDLIQKTILANELDLENRKNEVSSDVSAVVSMAGAIKNVAYIDADDVPLICFHGVKDDIVPYGCGSVYQRMSAYVKLLRVCGGLPMYEKAQAVGLPSELHRYDANHTPWGIKTLDQENELLVDVEQKIAEFLIKNW